MPQEGRNIAIIGGLAVAAGLAAFVGIILLTRKEQDGEPVVYICPYCEEEFASQTLLTTHIKAAHPDDPLLFPCPYCDLTFPYEIQLEQHIEQEHAEEEPGVGNLYGRITDAQTGVSIAGVDMTVYQDVTPTQTETYEVTTDAAGYYSISNMVAGVPADMVIYASGYVTFTKTGIGIVEGSVELNITLAWAGGPRDVPRVTGYSFPAGITSGGEFEAKLKVYLQNFTEYRIHAQLKLYSQETPRCNLTMKWKIVHRSIWEQLRESKKLEYTPFEGEGVIEISDIGVAVCKYWGEDMPPGLYDVSYFINRSYCEVTDTGGLQVWGSATPGFYTAKGQLGTVEVV